MAIKFKMKQALTSNDDPYEVIVATDDAAIYGYENLQTLTLPKDTEYDTTFGNADNYYYNKIEGTWYARPWALSYEILPNYHVNTPFISEVSFDDGVTWTSEPITSAQLDLIHAELESAGYINDSVRNNFTGIDVNGRLLLSFKTEGLYAIGPYEKVRWTGLDEIPIPEDLNGVVDSGLTPDFTATPEMLKTIIRNTTGATVSSTAPTDTFEGKLWFNSTTNELKIYTEDE